MTPSLTVLITGVGAPGVRGTLYSLFHNPENVRVRTIGVDTRVDAVGRFFVDSFRQIGDPERPEYTEQLLEVCRAEKVDIVLPQTSREVVRLADDRTILEDAGIAVMVGSSSAVKTASNKLLTLRAFEDAGLPVPGYRAVSDLDAIEAAAKAMGYPDLPVVAKLPLSNGMRGFRVLTSERARFDHFVSEKPDATGMRLDEFLEMCSPVRSLPTLLIGEYLPGPEYSVDVFRGVETGVAVPRNRREIRSGISFVSEITPYPSLSDQALKGSAAMGLTGAFGFQFKENSSGEPKLLECNPRVQGTMVAAVFAGVNVIWLAMCEALGRVVCEVPAPDTNAHFMRFWGGVGVIDEVGVEI